jgi:release factor glutamine methyltransferase
VNLKQALEHAREALRKSNIEDAALEGEILLRHVTGLTRASLFSKLEQELTLSQEKALQNALERRLKGEPTAYITGHKEFYGLDFVVNSNVLIPRPETELLVEKALELAKTRQLKTIADIGAGSGAIAISIAKNLPGVTIYAVDISAEALKVAEENCRRHGVADRIFLLQGNFLEPLSAPADLIIANLPYVKDSDIPQQGPLSYEPAAALSGGKDGLDAIREFCRQAPGKLKPKGCILMEIGQGQAEAVRKLLKNAFPVSEIQVFKDFAGIERVACLCLT